METNVCFHDSSHAPIHPSILVSVLIKASNYPSFFVLGSRIRNAKLYCHQH